MANCSALAKAISAAYLSTEAFNGTSTSDLQTYLSSHGVLTTMCMGPNITCAPDKHWSFSWINVQTTVRIIPDALIGMIAKPTAIDLQCIYPVDGGTDGRDNNGCGPITIDPLYGSQGAYQEHSCCLCC